MKKLKSTAEMIRNRVRSSKQGEVIVSRQFLDLGNRAAVDKALSRLVRSGDIRRIARGTFDKPRRNERLGITISPSPDVVAKAVSRGSSCKLQISGARAANALGLSTQVPAHSIYHTSGSSRTVRVGNQDVELRHAAPRTMATAGRASGVVIQALKYLGEKNVTREIVEQLRRTLNERDKAMLRRDRIYAPGWMNSYIEEIAAVDKAIDS